VPDTVRPSTLLRQERLQLLAAAFARRTLRQADVAALLDCSPSGARNYLNELVEAGVITPCRATPDERTFAKRAFVLHPEAPVHGMPPQRRDPLVAALFGAP
jgi:DNA-binding Lrp family transcriptional regulator